jgi:hypothetical protein
MRTVYARVLTFARTRIRRGGPSRIKVSCPVSGISARAQQMGFRMNTLSAATHDE